MSAHTVNLVLHIAAGAVAIVLGGVVLALRKGDLRHRWLGRGFGTLVVVVCTTALLGVIGFGSGMTFAVLTLTVAYQGLSAWRVAVRKHRGPAPVDLWISVLALLLALGLIGLPATWNVMALSSLAWLLLVLGYDLARWQRPVARRAAAWPLEHGLKWLACLSGMVSAMAGNVWRSAQPWSQLLPSLCGALAMGWLLWCHLRGANPDTMVRS